MYLEYQELSENAKVWVYPSSRKFYPQEINDLELKLRAFVTSWKQEDPLFKASFRFLYNRFIVFFIEEDSAVENIVLDQQVNFILALEAEYDIQLLDKMNVCFKQGEYIQYKDLKEFKKLLKNKSVSKNTVVFDNLVQTKYDFDNFWEVPITDSWYNRFL